MGKKSGDAGPADGTDAADQAGKKSVLEPFWSLADSDPATRLGAVRDLVGIPSVQVVGSTDHDYVVKRLVRGLSSSRGMARQGFVVALTQVLRACESLDVDTMLNLLIKSTEFSNAMRPQEQREHYFGRLFGLMALVRSGRCSENAKALNVVIEKALELSTKKAWIEEMALETVCDAVTACAPDKLAAVIANAGDFGLKGKKGLSDLTPQQLSLILTINVACQGATKAITALKSAAKEHNAPALVLPSHADSFAKTLWEDGMTPLLEACHTSPRMHSVWPKLLDFMAHDEDLLWFEEFWGHISEALMPVGGSHERKFTGLKVLEQSAKVLVARGHSERVVAVLFTDSVRRLVFSSARKKADILHDAALSSLGVIGQALHNEGVPSTARALLYQAIEDGNVGTKAVFGLVYRPDLLAKDTAKVEEELSLLKKAARRSLNSTGNGAWNPAHMHALIKPVKDIGERWRLSLDLANFLVECGAFRAKGEVDAATARMNALKVLPAVMSDLVALEEQALAVCAKDGTLEAYLAGSADHEEVPKLGASIAAINETFDRLTNDEKFETLLDTSEEDIACRSNAIELAKKLHFPKSSTSSRTRKRGAASTGSGEKKAMLSLGLAFFLQHMALQIIIIGEGDESGEVNVDSNEVIRDLIICSGKLAEEHGLFAASGSRKSKRGEVKEQDVDAPDSMAVLADAMIATLAQPSVLLRQVVSRTFQVASPFINAQALDVIFDVLLTNHLTVKKDEDDEDDEDGDDEEAMARDALENDESDDASKDEDDEDGTDDAKNDESMREAVKSASKEFIKGSGDSSVKAKDKNRTEHNEEQAVESGSDDDVSDHEGYNNALEAFVQASLDRNKKNSKTEKRKAEMEHITIKLRALDLVKALVQAGDNSLLALVPLPLMKAAERCFMSGGMVKKGVPGEVSQTLFARISDVMRILRRNKAALKCLAQAGDLDAQLTIPAGGICAATLSPGSDGDMDVDEGQLSITYSALLAKLVQGGMSGALDAANNKHRALCVQAAELGWTAGAQVLSADQFIAPYDEAAKEFATNKKSKIKRQLFEAPLKQARQKPHFAWPLARALAIRSQEATRVPMRVELLGLLNLTFAQGFDLENKQAVQQRAESVVPIAQAIAGYFTDSTSSKIEDKKRASMLSSKSVRVVLKLLREAHKSLGRNTDPKDKAMKLFFTTLKKGDTAKNLKHLCEAESKTVAPHIKSEIDKTLGAVFQVETDLKKRKEQKKLEHRKRKAAQALVEENAAVTANDVEGSKNGSDGGDRSKQSDEGSSKDKKRKKEKSTEKKSKKKHKSK